MNRIQIRLQMICALPSLAFLWCRHLCTICSSIWGENNIIQINLSISNLNTSLDQLIFASDDASLEKKRNEKQAKKQTKQSNRQVIL